MRNAAHELINSAAIEAWPAGLLRARAAAQQRQLAGARRLLRDKASGDYLATLHDTGDGSWWIVPLGAALSAPHAGLGEALAALELRLPGSPIVLRPRELAAAPRAAQLPAQLPLADLHRRLDELGLDADDYAARHHLALVPEPALLTLAGRDRFRRPLWLLPGAAQAWQRMRCAALADGVVLNAVSGYRSHDYQLGIFRRKRARGLEVADILAVNAAPGFSEHHSGRAIDIGMPGEPPAEESFERTAAFSWLEEYATRHGFRLSYPRDNPHQIVYEPWHWYWAGPSSP